MKIDDSLVMIPPYDGPNKTKLKDRKLSADQVKAMLANGIIDADDAEEAAGRKKMMDTKARPNRKQCMAAGCTSAPVIDVQWADGRGRAWFCLPHFEAWANEAQREIVRAWFVEGGEVPKKVKAYDRSAQVRTTGSGVGPKEIADRIRKLVQKRDRKAADEPPPNVRGQPLPEEEATEGWEITEEDIAAGQAWVDKAMKEAGFRD